MTAPRRFPLPAPDEAHIWWVDLGAPAAGADATLSADERARAARFHRERDRLRWIHSHAAVRHILGSYLGLPPHHLRFTTADPLAIPPSPLATGEWSRGVRAPSAKPALRNDSRLRFNLAHAGERAALAIAWEREVGIDLEPLDAGLDVGPLLAIACSPAEAAAIRATPQAQWHERFLQIWTAKEAYLKGVGLGMSRAPSALETEFLPEDRVIVHDRCDEEAKARWDVRLLDAGPGWVAALATAGASLVLRTFAWPMAPYASA